MKTPAEITPPSGSPPPARRSRFRGAVRLLIALAALFVVVVLLFPLIFAPRIDVPTDLPFGNPSSLSAQISNQNMTPLMDVEYTCELAKLTLANGSAVPNEQVLIRGAIRKIDGRGGALARCQAAYLVTAPLQAAEYKLTLAYRAYPWRRRRTSVYRIAAKIDSKGEVKGWKLE
jgi:hypothetical protein